MVAPAVAPVVPALILVWDTVVVEVSESAIVVSPGASSMRPSATPVVAPVVAPASVPAFELVGDAVVVPVSESSVVATNADNTTSDNVVAESECKDSSQKKILHRK